MTVAAVFSRRASSLTSRGFGKSQCLNNTLRSIPRTSSKQAYPSFVRYYADKSSLPSHTIVNMPALSPTMTSGNIGTWQKKAGDTIAPGDVLVEIETDKAQMDFEFQEDGVLAKILLDSGEKDVGVGSPIAVMVEDEGDVEAFKDFTVEDAGGKAAPKKDEGGDKDESKDESSGKEEKPKEPKSAEETKPKTGKVEAPPAVEESSSSGGKLQTSLSRLEGIEFMASPAAKVLALEKGVPLSKVKGTGSGGRIVKEDIEKFSGPTGGATGGGTALSPTVATPGTPADEDVAITGMRKSIATRLKDSKNNAPHYYVMSSCSVTKMLKLRQALNASANGEFKLSVNDLIVKSLATALAKHPRVNSSWLDKEGVIRQYASVDISVAVATPVGLITPIVKQAHAKGLQAISSEIKLLATKARDGKLKPEEYQGGTFTISNLGMNDAIDRFTAIINPPQSGILAVGAAKKIAVPGVDNSVEWDDQIVVTGSFDHRIVDGAVGAEFMKTLKKIIENPLDMLL